MCDLRLGHAHMCRWNLEASGPELHGKRACCGLFRELPSRSESYHKSFESGFFANLSCKLGRGASGFSQICWMQGMQYICRVCRSFVELAAQAVPKCVVSSWFRVDYMFLETRNCLSTFMILSLTGHVWNAHTLLLRECMLRTYHITQN